MKLVFIHGWSVTSTNTYGDLPLVLQKNAPKELNLEIENIYLGEYISFHNEVTLEDIARAFESARQEKLGDERFACITHSTGGPLIRVWIETYFHGVFLKNTLSHTPITHLIMLAPANHGSSLAILGKSKLSRIESWFKGVEVGVGILDWLQLGSTQQWELNNSLFSYKYNDHTFFPFVLSGEKIDTHFYDFINNYLVEKGSDGVIRLCGANLNYKTLTLQQNCNTQPFDSRIDGETIKAYPLDLQDDIKITPQSAFEVIPNASHTGDKYGIMQNIKKNKKIKPIVNSIIEALKVKNNNDYKNITNTMIRRSEKLQINKQQYIMFIINVKDNYGKDINDYDMILLAGETYEPSRLPKGFFVDKQKNNLSGNIVYYLNYNKLKNIKDGKLGIRIVARPLKGFIHYTPAEFRSDKINLKDFLVPNQTLMIEIILERLISKNTFVLDKINQALVDFKNRNVDNKFID